MVHGPLTPGHPGKRFSVRHGGSPRRLGDEKDSRPIRTDSKDRRSEWTRTGERPGVNYGRHPSLLTSSLKSKTGEWVLTVTHPETDSSLSGNFPVKGDERSWEEPRKAETRYNTIKESSSEVRVSESVVSCTLVQKTRKTL